MPPQDKQDDRQKVTFKLPASLKADLKIRSAELGVDIQDAVAVAMTEWGSAPKDESSVVDTAGSPPFATWLTDAMTTQFKAECSARGIPYVQGLAQSVSLWLTTHPSPAIARRKAPPDASSSATRKAA